MCCTARDNVMNVRSEHNKSELVGTYGCKGQRRRIRVYKRGTGQVTKVTKSCTGGVHGRQTEQGVKRKKADLHHEQGEVHAELPVPILESCQLSSRLHVKCCLMHSLTKALQILPLRQSEHAGQVDDSWLLHSVDTR